MTESGTLEALAQVGRLIDTARQACHDIFEIGREHPDPVFTGVLIRTEGAAGNLDVAARELAEAIR